MQHDLVDEFHFWMFPVAVGCGQRLLDGSDTTHLKLVDEKAFRSGIVVLVYAQIAVEPGVLAWRYDLFAGMFKTPTARRGTIAAWLPSAQRS